MPPGQSATVNAASQERGLTGKPVTESYLSLCVPAQISALPASACNRKRSIWVSVVVVALV